MSVVEDGLGDILYSKNAQQYAVQFNSLNIKLFKVLLLKTDKQLWIVLFGIAFGFNRVLFEL